ncbi:MAG: class I SAM-dependent methyltransferase, partial [Planctomycetota bacterium]
IDREEFDYVRCCTCDFKFKSPEIPEEALLDCYARAQGDRWGHKIDPIERNFDRIAKAIQDFYAGGRILDIGCSNGEFLRFLPDQWAKYGIEPSTEAAEIAISSGIEILSSTLDGLRDQDKFDAIVAMDVMEHLPSPLTFINQVASHLSPGGIFIVTTGNTDAWSWRLQKSQYWYCASFPEHVSFYNKESIKALSAKAGLELSSFGTMSYKRTSLSRRVSQNIKGTAFGVGRATNWFGLPPLKRKFKTRAGTNWASANDHMIAVMQKPQN